MDCKSYSFPKDIPKPKAQDVGQTHADFVGNLVSSRFFPQDFKEGDNGKIRNSWL